jgi:SAM-dependent MidA family methyltransferase
MITYLQKLISTSPTKLITYADYMNAVLYHPEQGYYMKDKAKIGRQGDFITTSNISDLYGKMTARWFLHSCLKTGLDAVFCEIGAGNGRFAHAFLQEWYKSAQSPITYIIVETSPYHRKLQTELLAPDFSVIQVASLEEVESFEGTVFSNELFDALPVHVIEQVNGQLFEVMIGCEDEKLFEVLVPNTNEDIFAFLQESGITLIDHQRLEIPLLMEKMLKQMSRALKKGVVVTADYGYTNEEWKLPARKQGSLRGFYQHKMINDVLEHPGEMDITTHIHFDWLIKKGEELNLKFITKLRQDQFLLKTGILKELENHYDPNPFSEVSKRNRAIRSLIMPAGISSYFSIVIQHKNLEIKSSDELFEF